MHFLVPWGHALPIKLQLKLSWSNNVINDLFTVSTLHSPLTPYNGLRDGCLTCDVIDFKVYITVNDSLKIVCIHVDNAMLKFLHVVLYLEQRRVQGKDRNSNGLHSLQRRHSQLYI